MSSSVVRKKRERRSSDEDEDDTQSVSKRGSRASRMSKPLGMWCDADTDDDDDALREPMVHVYRNVLEDCDMVPNQSLMQLLADLDRQLEAAPGDVVAIDLSRMHIGHRHVLLLCKVLTESRAPVGTLSLSRCSLHNTALPALAAALGRPGSKITSLDLSYNPSLSYLAGRDILTLLKKRRRLTSIDVSGTAIHAELQNRISKRAAVNVANSKNPASALSVDVSLEGFRVPKSFLSVHHPPVLVSFSSKDTVYVRRLCDALSRYDPRLAGAFALFHHRKTSPDYQEFIKTCFIEADYLLVVASDAWCSDPQCVSEYQWFRARSCLVVLPELFAADEVEVAAECVSESGSARDEAAESDEARLAELQACSSAYTPRPDAAQCPLKLLRCTADTADARLRFALPFVLCGVEAQRSFHVPPADLDAALSAAADSVAGPPEAVRSLADAVSDELRASQSFTLPRRGCMKPLSRWQKCFVLVTQALSPDNPTHVSLYPRLVRRMQQHRKQNIGVPFLPKPRVLTRIELVFDQVIQAAKTRHAASAPATSRMKKATGNVLQALKAKREAAASTPTSRARLTDGSRAAAAPASPAAASPTAAAATTSTATTTAQQRRTAALLRVSFDVDEHGRFFYRRLWRESLATRPCLGDGGCLYVPNPARQRLRQVLADEESRVSRERAAIARESRGLRVTQRSLASKVRQINHMEDKADADKAAAEACLSTILQHVDAAALRETRALQEPRLTDAVRMLAKAVLAVTDPALADGQKDQPLEWWWEQAQTAFAAENQLLYHILHLRRVKARQWSLARDFLACPAFAADAAAAEHERWESAALQGRHRVRGVAVLARWVHCLHRENQVARRLEIEVYSYIDDLHDEYKAISDQATEQEQHVGLLQEGVGNLQQQVGERIRQYSLMPAEASMEQEEDEAVAEAALPALRRPHSRYYAQLRACPLLQGLPRRVLADLARTCPLRQFDRRLPIPAGAELLLILAGRVQLAPAETGGLGNNGGGVGVAAVNGGSDSPAERSPANASVLAVGRPDSGVRAALELPPTDHGGTPRRSRTSCLSFSQGPSEPPVLSDPVVGMLLNKRALETLVQGETASASAGAAGAGCRFEHETSMRSLKSAADRRRSLRSVGSFVTDGSDAGGGGSGGQTTLNAGQWLHDAGFLRELRGGIVLQTGDGMRATSLGGPRGRPVVALAVSKACVAPRDRPLVLETVEKNRVFLVARARRAFFLRQLPLLKGMGAEVVIAVAAAADTETFTPDAIVAEEGVAAPALRLVASGSVVAAGRAGAAASSAGVFFPSAEEVLGGALLLRAVRAGAAGCECVAVAREALRGLCATFASLRERLAGLPEEAAFGEAARTLGARGSSVAAPWVDFNERFQTLLEGVPATRGAAEDRQRRLAALRAAFVRAAQPLAEMVVSELQHHADPGRRSLPPAHNATNLPCVGGQRYLINGLLLEVAGNKGNIYGTAASAAKALKHEFRAWECVLTTGVKGVSVPLVALVTFRGFRVKVSALLPVGGADSAVHGGADGRGDAEEDGERMRECPEIGAALKSICTMLNLKGHRVSRRGSRLFHGPADLEVRKGADGRFYLLRPGRLFPPQALTPGRHSQGQWLVQLLRPEAVKKSKTALSSDAYSRWGSVDRASDDAEVSALCRHMHHEVTPAFAAHLATLYEGYAPPDFDGDLGNAELLQPLQRLCAEAHAWGVNMRRLSAVLTMLPNGSVMLSRLLHIELISRTFKSTLFKEWRLLPRLSTEVCEEEACRLLSLLFGTGPRSQVFVRDVLHPHCKAKFGFECLEEYFACLPTMHITAQGVARVEYVGFSEALDVIKRTPGLNVTMLARVCELCGLQLSHTHAKGHYDRVREACEESDSRRRKHTRNSRSSMRSSTSSSGSHAARRKTASRASAEDGTPFKFLAGIVSVVHSMALPQDDAADAFRRRGRLDLAEASLRERMAAMARVVGDEHVVLVRPLTALAAVCAECGRRPEQGALLERALRLCASDLCLDEAGAGGRRHSLDEVQTMIHLAGYHARSSQEGQSKTGYGKAAYLLSLAHEALLALGFGYSNATVQECLFALGDAEERQLNHAQAQEAYVLIRTEAEHRGLPRHSRVVATATLGIAKALIGQFDLETSRAEIEALLTVLEAQPTCANPDLLPRAYDAHWLMYGLKGCYTDAVPILHKGISTTWAWLEEASGEDSLSAADMLGTLLSRLQATASRVRGARLEETMHTAASRFPEIEWFIARAPSDVHEDGCVRPDSESGDTDAKSADDNFNYEALVHVFSNGEIAPFRRRVAYAMLTRHLTLTGSFEALEGVMDQHGEAIHRARERT